MICWKSQLGRLSKREPIDFNQISPRLSGFDMFSLCDEPDANRVLVRVVKIGVNLIQAFKFHLKIKFLLSFSKRGLSDAFVPFNIPTRDTPPARTSFPEQDCILAGEDDRHACCRIAVMDPTALGAMLAGKALIQQRIKRC